MRLSARGADRSEAREDALSVGPDGPVGVRARAVHQGQGRRPEALCLADSLRVDLRVRGDDERLSQVVVRDLLLPPLVHALRLVPVVRVELLGLGPLPDPRAPEGVVVVLRPRELGLEDDLAGLLAGSVAPGAIRVDDGWGALRVGERP